MARARSTEPRPWTVEEFLEWERAQDERYEYVGGIVRMMVGGTSDHHTISLNVATTLKARLRGSGCRAYMEGMKVTTAAGVMYPDVVATCSPVPPKSDDVPGPVVVVEVLSRSTESFDRGAKWLAYRTLSSLAQYVLVSQDERRVEIFERDGDDWRYHTVEREDGTIRFAVGGIAMTVAEVYEGTSLDPRAPASAG